MLFKMYTLETDTCRKKLNYHVSVNNAMCNTLETDYT